MSEDQMIRMVSDLEKIIPVKDCVGIDIPEENEICSLEIGKKSIFLRKEDINNLKRYKAEEYLLTNRSGEEIICGFLDAVVNKEIAPKFAVIVKKWSVLGNILQRYSDLSSRYSVYCVTEDKSICFLIKNKCLSDRLKEDFIKKYQLKGCKLPHRSRKESLEAVSKSIHKKFLKKKFLRNLYSVWKENRGIKNFAKAIWGIIKERTNANKFVVEEVPSDKGLDICIYDTDKECIVKSEGNIVCNTVSVVVCVYNALDDVKELLTSLWNSRSFPYDIILIDDGSEKPTKEYLEYYSKLTGCQLIRHSEPWGYTRSANDGLRRATSDYVVLLNSDTIVTSKWIEKMLEVFWRHPETGMVGPLSNSATYQNVPELHDLKSGGWAKNLLPDGFSVELMNYTLEINSAKAYPVVPALNGFCTMISRKLINEIGILDEKNFPVGYGEEVDYCLRARRAGFTLRVADDTYIFHEKSKSFGNANKKALSKQAVPYLTKKYGDMYTSIGKEFEKNEVLGNVRKHYSANVEKTLSVVEKVMGKKIGFVLLTRGGNGGANSVCQEVIGMRKLGVDAYVINSGNYKNAFSNNYPELQKYTCYYKKGSVEDLYEKTKDFDILIATIFTSVSVIREVMKKNPHLKSAYYIQDYETLFFEKEDIMYKEAYDSYSLIPNNCLFAKTNWLVNMVSDNHGIRVNKVTPSIDIRVYNPYLIKSKIRGEKINVVAMVRPRTPRRNPSGTLNVLGILKKKFEDRINIIIFGCTENELEQYKELCQFEYQNRGVLKKGDVAALMAESDIFIDMSYYQAFGRTGLEGMCYACIPVLPIEGGTDEYAVHNVNSVVIDTKDDNAVAAAVAEIINEPGKIQAMQKEAVLTARRYCVLPASWSELKILNEQCG